MFEIASVATLVTSSMPAASIDAVFAIYLASNSTDMTTSGAVGKMTRAIFHRYMNEMVTPKMNVATD